jgi:hypothetical protein
MKKAVTSAHNLLIFLCVAAALLVALGSPVAALVLRLLVPAWFFVALVVVAVVPTRKDTGFRSWRHRLLFSLRGLPRNSSSPQK